MRAYEQLPEDIRRRYSLVIAGGKGWKDEEILKTLSALEASGAKIIRTGYVSDEDRAALFIGTALYIMPSHYEGFGMQLLEGMSYGTPMLVSDIPVLHEVGGNATAYCGTAPEQIADGITRVLTDSSLQETMVAAGKKRIVMFSWDNVATDIFVQIKESVR